MYVNAKEAPITILGIVTAGQSCFAKPALHNGYIIPEGGGAASHC